MKLHQLLRRSSFPVFICLPGLLSIQAGNVVFPPPRPTAMDTALTFAEIEPILNQVNVRAAALALPASPDGDPLSLVTSPRNGPSASSKAKVLSEPLSSMYIRFNGFKTFMSNTYALNPTRGPVRRMGMDRWGGGEYRASRYDPKTRRRSKHNGIDYAGKAGQRVMAPISGELRKVGRGFTSGAVIVGHINGRKYLVRLLHFDPTVSNGLVVQGQPIGRLKNSGKWYRGMTPHAHMEIHEVRGRYSLKERNPALLVRLAQ